MSKELFVKLKWKTKGSSGIIIKSSIMKKSFQLINTWKGIRTKEGRENYLILRKKRNGNLELYDFVPESKKITCIVSFNEKIIRDGKYSFWYTIGTDVRRGLEFENRSGKLIGFKIFVNKEKHIEMRPVFKRHDE
ncbi:MAG: hypothetical protein IIC67_02930 [Thaumarchaeota archaeon]|nr:hypothetical protein [Nitrososphaerota archaeon]